MHDSIRWAAGRGSTKRRGKKRPIHRFPKPVDKERERERDASVAALQLFACGRCERTSCSLICELCLDSMPAWKVEEERETCVPVNLGEGHPGDYALSRWTRHQNYVQTSSIAVDMGF